MGFLGAEFPGQGSSTDATGVKLGGYGEQLRPSFSDPLASHSCVMTCCDRQVLLHLLVSFLAEVLPFELALKQKFFDTLELALSVMMLKAPGSAAPHRAVALVML